MWRRFTSSFAEFQQPSTSIMADIQNGLQVKSANLTPNLSFRRNDLDCFRWMLSVAPCFPVKAEKVSIIHEPSIFYETLIEKCSGATERITLASLYLGTGNLEKRLVSAIHDKLKQSGGNVRVNVLLDYQRGNRGEFNSKKMLLPLLECFGNYCRFSLYHTPHLRGFTKRMLPPRWNELIETQHMKVYLIDDTVIFSGANLSNDYFTNRQDRYVMIEDKDLANFYSNLVKEVQEISLEVNADGSYRQSPGCPSPYAESRNKYVSYAKQKLTAFYQSAIDTQMNKDKSDTWVMPLIQAGGLDIKSDSIITKKIISMAPQFSKIKLATGYFNLTQEYADALVKECQSDVTLLMAHPNANGFMGAKGPAGGVPDAYSLLARKFYEYVQSCGQEKRIKLLEFEKPGWTYHGKGLWYYLPQDSLPSMTLIGSPNFGERSVYRDLETQVAIITTNSSLQNDLQKECDHLHSESREANDLTNRIIPMWVKMTVGLFRNYF